MIAVSFLFIIFMALLSFLDYKFSQWLYQEPRQRLTGKSGRLYNTGICMIPAIFLVIAYTTGLGLDDRYKDMGFILLFFILLFSFQAIMEHRFLESKQYRIPIYLMAVSVICIIGIYTSVHQIRYTTFQQTVSNELNEETTIHNISLTVNDVKEYTRIKQTKIEDPAIIQEIIDGLSNMKLKKLDYYPAAEKYTLEIEVTNKIAKQHYATDILSIGVDENHFEIHSDCYAIYDTNDHTDPLETIRTLLDKDSVQWNYYSE